MDTDIEEKAAGDGVPPARCETPSPAFHCSGVLGAERTPTNDRHDEYDGPNDKRNPRNWSFASRLFHTTVPNVLGFQITVATSATVPAAELIMKEFNVSRTASMLPITLYTLGIAIGPLLIAPFSEVWGRKWIYVATSTCLMAFLAGAATANSFAALLVCRFLASTLGSAGLSVGAGTLADVWDQERDQVGSHISILAILVSFLGPSLGPLAGAYVLENREYNWRWTQYFLLILGAPSWVACLLMKETSRKWILREQRPVTIRQILRTAKAAVLRPAGMLLTEVVVSSLTIYSTFAHAMVFSYFSSTSYVLRRFYGFNLREVGLSLISVIIGNLLATALYMAIDTVVRVRASRKNPPVLPTMEDKLYGAICGSVFLPSGLFWYAWETHQGGDWKKLVPAGILIGLGSFALVLSVLTYLIRFYGSGAAASAVGANGMLRYTVSAVFPLFSVQMFEKLGVNWAGSIFGFIAIGLLPVPWLLFKYGEQMRNRSKVVK